MKSQKIIGIVAMTPQRVIGNEGELPWHLPEDLKFFKKTTLDHTILMGRKTYDSIGRPLPKRKNVVITRDEAWAKDGVEVIHSLDQLAQLTSPGESIFIIGGAEIYSLALPFMDELIVTHVRKNYAGDTVFPEYLHLFPMTNTLHEGEDFFIVKYYK